jgi:cystathionine gamma-synthase
MSKLGGNHVVLYGRGSKDELDELEDNLKKGKNICALFTEFPTNPLLTCVDLRRIRRLADEYSFVVVCDDTVGTSVNLDIFQYVDILVTSLTKLFSGACDVMGGRLVLSFYCRKAVH